MSMLRFALTSSVDALSTVMLARGVALADHPTIFLAQSEPAERRSVAKHVPPTISRTW
jgi:hypothetical protein